MSHDPVHPANLKEFTVLMAMLMSVVAISIDAMLPALGVIGGDLRVENLNHTQYVIGLLFAGMAAGQLVAGPLSDAFGRKRVLYYGIGLYLAGTLTCYFADTFEALLVGRLIQGLGVAGPYVSAVSIVRDRYSGRDMARAMSIIMMIFIMVPAVAPSLGQAVLAFASWRAIFLLYAVYACVVTAWIFFRLEETLPPERRIPFRAGNLVRGLQEVFSNRVTVGYTACMGVCFGAFIGYLNSSAQIFQIQFGVGDMFAIYFGALALVFGLSSLLNAQLVGRFGMRAISRWGFSGIALLSAVFLGLHLVTAITLPIFLAFLAAVFFLFGLVFGNLNAIALEPMGQIAGLAAAITGAASSAMSLCIGSLIGQLYNGTLVPVFSGFAVLSLCALVVMKLADRQRG